MELSPLFIIGEVRQPGGYRYACCTRSRSLAAFTYRENDVLIRRADDPSDESQAANPITISRDVQVWQRFF